MTIAYRWFVWDGRYAIEPAEPTGEPVLYAARHDRELEPSSALTVELDMSHEVELDNRISVQIESTQTFSARRLRPRFLRARGHYVAVKLALGRIECIGGLLVLVHRMKHPCVDEPDRELLVHRRRFLAEHIRDACPADVESYFGRKGKPRGWGAVIGDVDARLASHVASLYRFSAWAAHDAEALALDPRKLALPREALQFPMCVSDRSAAVKPHPTRASGDRDANLGVLDGLQALWQARWD